jgi:hypothetical protein
MRLAALVEPAAPVDETPISFELWKMARRTFEKQTEARRRNSSRVYALVIGQCSQALWNRMEATVFGAVCLICEFFNYQVQPVPRLHTLLFSQKGTLFCSFSSAPIRIPLQPSPVPPHSPPKQTSATPTALITSQSQTPAPNFDFPLTKTGVNNFPRRN